MLWKFLLPILFELQRNTWFLQQDMATAHTANALIIFQRSDLGPVDFALFGHWVASEVTWSCSLQYFLYGYVRTKCTVIVGSIEGCFMVRNCRKITTNHRESNREFQEYSAVKWWKWRQKFRRLNFQYKTILFIK